ncbi:MAG: AAA family ATPase [Clostridia bacterium]|nr:AAA family ATPase [Clostridia bacterium]
MKIIKKIVLTGGPCGGKSSGLAAVERHFTDKGYKVLIIRESATELMLGGLSSSLQCPFQRASMKLQLEKEKIFSAIAEEMPDQKILIICDRGVVDGRVYIPEEEYLADLALYGTDEVEVRDRYDGVFHMVTAAYGAEEFYTLANNDVRSETPEEARILDDRLKEAWSGHPHFRIIQNNGDFKEKLRKLIKEIAKCLGEPDPGEINKRFIIRKPDIAALEAIPGCCRVDIAQSYLVSTDPNTTIRVRQRGLNGTYSYTKTVKRKLHGGGFFSTEIRITKEEYRDMTFNADPILRPIMKNRYCLVKDNIGYKIDVYPFWSDYAILEAEMDPDDELILPDFVEIVSDITGDQRFYNHSLARKLPDIGSL